MVIRVIQAYHLVQVQNTLC